MDEYYNEWTYRAPTLAEQVSDMVAHWDGPRCPHGTPLGAPGPDLVCPDCEQAGWEEEMHEREVEHHDRTGRWVFPLGPHRWEAGVPDPAEPEMVPGLDDCPF